MSSLKKSEVLGMAVADLHLGYRQYGLPERADDFYSAFENVVDQAIALKVEFVILAGDVLNSVYPHSRSVKVLQEQTQRLADSKIKILAIMGNHDNVSPSWHELAHGEHLTINKVLDVSGIKISGMDYFPDDVAVENLKNVPDCDIFVCHQSFAEFTPFKGSSALKVSALNTEVKLYVFGDLHIHELRTLAEGCQAGYPGSIELNSSSEPFEKRFWLLHCAPGKSITVEPRKIRTRPVLTADVVSEEDLTKVSSAICKQHDSYLSDPDLKRLYGGKPLVYVTYDLAVTAAVPRLRALVGEKCILRMAPVAVTNMVPVRYDQARDIVDIRNVLANFVPAGSPEFATAIRLLENPAGLAQTIQDLMATVNT